MNERSTYGTEQDSVLEARRITRHFSAVTALADASLALERNEVLGLGGGRIVILDEPTAALGVRESRQVLDVIKDLRKHDVSVIVVSHNMQQLMDVADRITVMRLGRTVATRVVKETTVEEIIGLITGAIGADPDEETRLVTESAA